jgi:hypothetical protein
MWRNVGRCRIAANEFAAARAVMRQREILTEKMPIGPI